MSEKDIVNDLQQTDTNSTQNTKQSPISVIIDYVEIFAVSLALVIFVFSSFVRICKVVGPSMENTLYQGEKLIVSSAGYTPQREDIIVFHQTGTLNEPVVKRVIATEGETVTIDFNDKTTYMSVTITDKDGNTFVLDEKDYMNLDSSFVRSEMDFEMPYTVPEGCLFVMGDNRNHSTDSRSTIIGPVDERRILGKVILRIAPFDKFGKVD